MNSWSLYILNGDLGNEWFRSKRNFTLNPVEWQRSNCRATTNCSRADLQGVGGTKIPPQNLKANLQGSGVSAPPLDQIGGRIDENERTKFPPNKFIYLSNTQAGSTCAFVPRVQLIRQIVKSTTNLPSVSPVDLISSGNTDGFVIHPYSTSFRFAKRNVQVFGTNCPLLCEVPLGRSAMW